MAAKCVLDPEEVEQLILDAIRKIRENKQRADANSVCKTLSKNYGLDDSTTTLQLTMMIATGQIQSVKHRGAESLRLSESQAQKETKKDDFQNKKEENVRKISGDETRLEECRAELREETEPECHGDEDDEDVGVRESSRDSSVFIVKKKEQHIIEMEIEQRFVGLERQISEIMQRLDREGEQKSGAETEAFLLQREHKNLKGENLALRLEIADLKEIFRKNSEKRSEKKA